MFLCVHPNEPFHLDILREVCERFIFVQKGRITEVPDYATLTARAEVRDYLGALVA